MMKFCCVYLLGILGYAAADTPKRAALISDQVQVSEAVLIQPPPGAPVMGAYLTIVARADDRLIGVASDLAAEVQMHTMSHADGRMQMRQLDFIELPANTPVRLERGGLHLMLMQPFERPEIGEKVNFTLQFERAGGLRVQFEVLDGRQQEPATEAEHHHHH